MRVLVALFLVGLCTTLAAQTPATTISPELKKLNGYWKCQSVKYDDTEQMPDAKTRNLLTLVIKDSEYRMYYLSDPEKDLHFRLFTAEIKIEPKEKSFELLVKDGSKKGERRHGIYEHKENTLKICYGPADKPRPQKFEAVKGSDTFCEVWTLEPKKSAP